MTSLPPITSLRIADAFAASSPPHRDFVKVMVFNMQRGRRLDRWAALFRDADVLILNEVDVGMARSENVDVAAALAERLGLHCVFATEYQELTLGGPSERWRLRGHRNTLGLHGNAILSRWPIEKPRRIALPELFPWHLHYERRLGNRIALVAEVALPTGRVCLASVHLEVFTRPQGRREQLRAVLEALPSGPAVIAGDFNTFGIEATWRTPMSIRGLQRALTEPFDVVLREPLFADAERAGFHWRAANTNDGTWTPSALVPRFLRPRLDWILYRDVCVSRPETVLAPHGGPTAPGALSDHDGLSLMLESAPA